MCKPVIALLLLLSSAPLLSSCPLLFSLLSSTNPLLPASRPRRGLFAYVVQRVVVARVCVGAVSGGGK
jgi:hypothetical protein